MILNENYFDDIEITDDDIQSPEVDAPSSYDKYDNPEQMFADMKSKYAHCIDIPLMHYCQRKWDLSLILKKLFYIFKTYRRTTSDATLSTIMAISSYQTTRLRKRWIAVAMIFP